MTDDHPYNHLSHPTITRRDGNKIIDWDLVTDEVEIVEMSSPELAQAMIDNIYRFKLILEFHSIYGPDKSRWPRNPYLRDEDYT